MKVTLRKLHEDQAEKLAELASNKKIWDNVRDYFPYPFTTLDAVDFIRKKKQDDPTTHFGVYLGEDFTGVIGIDPMNDVFRKTGYIGYWIGEPYWGKGIATEAIGLMAHYGFETLELIKIQAGVFGHNKASMRVLEKSGFQLEGNLRKAAIKNDQVVDDLIYGLINPELQVIDLNVAAAK